jgi:hypothetical protein
MASVHALHPAPRAARRCLPRSCPGSVGGDVDLPAYPERYATRLATSTASPYLLLADTLAGIRAMLPPGMVCSERMPVDPPEVVEIGFAGIGGGS